MKKRIEKIKRSNLIITLKKASGFTLMLCLILFLSLLIRVYNLNYNSPFNDEAIYIVIGKLAVFEGDIWSYNAGSWVGGSSYIYPTISAIAYSTGGILGSRLLNTIFGVLSVEIIFYLSYHLSKFTRPSFKSLSALITASLLGGSAIAVYISRLATYDTPAFLLLLLSFLSLVVAEQKDSNTGKWYFLSVIFLILSFYTKIITVIFIPFVFIYSLIRAKTIGGQKMYYWKRYYLTFFIISIIFYLAVFKLSFLDFLNFQLDREKASYPEIMNTFIDYTKFLIPFYLTGTIGLLISKQIKKWLGLSLAALLIVVVHLITQRIASFDKHIFLSIMFMCLVSGEGISQLVYILRDKTNKNLIVKKISLTSLFLILVTYWVVSYTQTEEFNFFWPNSTKVSEQIASKVKSGDTVLAESGADVILKTYDKNFPTNTTTFDYFVYRNFTGEETYSQAVNDGYFRYIQLVQNILEKDDQKEKINQIVRQKINQDYKLVYSDNYFLLYERIY